MQSSKRETEMACQVVNQWSFSELVAAFLDLTIAYWLLCASASSFFASKFLGIFGLSLPCPCEGQFWNPTSINHCLQNQLIESSYAKISSVRSLARKKGNFSLERGDDMIVKSESKLASDGEQDNGNSEVKFGFGDMDFEGFKEEECGAKGKRLSGQRLRNGLRRRRLREGSFSNGKVPSASSFDTLRSDPKNTPQSPPSIRRSETDDPEDRYGFRGDREAPIDFGVYEKSPRWLELDNSKDSNNTQFDGRVVLVEEGNLGQLGLENNKKNRVQILEHTLEEERAARSSLYVELDKERSAAASAADEAMAMILRLQEEKASIEMESRQYQRMIEAKAAYDAEEMNILKEILIRREREKHFLEKEVESYRQMAFESDHDVQDVTDMLNEINDSIEKPKKVSSIKSLNRTLAFGNELPFPDLDADLGHKQHDIKDSLDIMVSEDSCVHDVHVVNSEKVEKNEPQSIQFTQNDVSRSCSDIFTGLPPRSCSREKGSFSDLRRNSMSVVDYERVKIDNEVEWLTERLRIVQKGRESLNFSADHKERIKSQTPFSENISSRMLEIQRSNERGKAECQASLPPSSSKVTPKKRRWRSASLNVHRST